MSYPQMHWKELVTKTVNEYVAMETSFPIQDWIGKYRYMVCTKDMGYRFVDLQICTKSAKLPEQTRGKEEGGQKSTFKSL